MPRPIKILLNLVGLYYLVTFISTFIYTWKNTDDNGNWTREDHPWIIRKANQLIGLY